MIIPVQWDPCRTRPAPVDLAGQISCKHPHLHSPAERDGPGWFQPGSLTPFSPSHGAPSPCYAPRREIFINLHTKGSELFFLGRWSKHLENKVLFNSNTTK